MTSGIERDTVTLRTVDPFHVIAIELKALGIHTPDALIALPNSHLGGLCPLPPA